MHGIVYLVGAGPGDPELLTLRGKECLARADVVFYDGLVNPLLLRLTRGECVRTSRVKDDAGPHVEQAEVNARLVAAAREGKTVVRLKGGDPFLFGRGSEEAAALAEAGIPFEVVPGVTAAIAAGEYAGISFTRRHVSSAVAFVTGHEDPTKPSSQLDFDALARFPGTLVFYMGLTRLEEIARSLIDHGMNPSTPAAVISRASLPAQRTVTAPLGEVAQRVAEAKLRAPTLIVVGDCVRQREQIAWFERRPLFGLRIGITRPQMSQETRVGRQEHGEYGVEATIRRCLELGAEPVLMPAIRVGPVDPQAIDPVLQRLGEFNWVVFTSANGVRAAMDRLLETGGDARRFGHARIACIGPATAEALAEYSLRADLVPESYRAEDLAAALAPHVAGRSVLWARATRGRDVLPEALTAAGARVEQAAVYENADVEELPADVLNMLRSERLDWIGLSSPSIACNLARLLPPELVQRTRFAAISPVTAAAATESGIPVSAVATEFTWDGLFAAIATAAASELTR